MGTFPELCGEMILALYPDSRVIERGKNTYISEHEKFEPSITVFGGFVK